MIRLQANFPRGSPDEFKNGGQLTTGIQIYAGMYCKQKNQHCKKRMIIPSVKMSDGRARHTCEHRASVGGTAAVSLGGWEEAARTRPFGWTCGGISQATPNAECREGMITGCQFGVANQPKGFCLGCELSGTRMFRRRGPVFAAYWGEYRRMLFLRPLPWFRDALRAPAAPRKRTEVPPVRTEVPRTVR